MNNNIFLYVTPCGHSDTASLPPAGTEPSTLLTESRSYNMTGDCRPGGSHRDIYLKWEEMEFTIGFITLFLSGWLSLWQLSPG